MAVKISEIIPKTNVFFPEAEYLSLGDLIGKKVMILDYKGFENREGRPSVTMKLKLGDKVYRTITHSQAILDLLTTDSVVDAIALEHEVEATIVQKKSQKTGRLYITLE